MAGSVNAGWVRLTWHWPLASGEARELRWLTWSVEERPTAKGVKAGDAADPDDALFPPEPVLPVDEVAASYHAWNRSVSEIRTDNELVNLAINRSTSDLRLLVNDGPGEAERYLAAGVPWFTTLFGRDALIASFQALCVRPQVAVETLEVLASLQAADEDPERDAEPGKILHELRTGEMARTGELPFRPYYGSVDATPLWLILFAATYDWTGDRGLVDRLWPNALRALDWIDHYGDRDGDGFVEYERRTPRGLVNQGWKDSQRRHPRPARDGSRRPRSRSPRSRATCSTRRRGWPGSRGCAARRTWRAASRRTPRPCAAGSRTSFWSEEQAFYVMALDGEKRQADAIASNAGPLPVVGDRLARPRPARGRPPDGARHVQRLGDPDVRLAASRATTRSATTRARSGRTTCRLIAAGFKRYGRHEEANRLVGRIFEAAQHFADFRLPELFCGFDRDHSPVPVPYPVACSPQAWAAGSLFLFLETMLGLRPHADRRELELERPELPGLAPEGDRHEPAGRRRRGGPAVPPLARRHVRGGAAQEPRPRRHHPDVAPMPDAASTVVRARPRRHRADRRVRLRTRRASTRSCCWARRWAIDRTGHPRPPGRPGRRRTRARRSRPPSPAASAASRSPTSAASASSTGSPSRPTRGP